MSAEQFAVRFGALVRARRLELGITQTRLADTLGISQPSVSSWESGDSVPTALALLGLLRALRLTLKDVVVLLDEPNGEAAA